MARCVAFFAALTGLAGAEQSLIASDGAFLADRDAATQRKRSRRLGHQLRVCNAFPHELPLQVFYDGRRLTEQSLRYKDCGTWSNVGLTFGKHLDFKVGDESAGTLVVSDLPWVNAVVAVVVYDLQNLAGSFESQVFEDMDAPQVAVFDAYRGPAEASLLIRDPADHDSQRKEELRYDSAVIIRPGRYDLVLEDSAGSEQARTAFGVADDESYVVVRCGGERKAGSFEQDVFVYPASKVEVQASSSSSESSGWGTGGDGWGSSSESSGASDSSASSSSGGGGGSESGSSSSSLDVSIPHLSSGGAGGLAALAALTLLFTILAMTCLSRG